MSRRQINKAAKLVSRLSRTASPPKFDGLEDRLGQAVARKTRKRSLRDSLMIGTALSAGVLATSLVGTTFIDVRPAMAERAPRAEHRRTKRRPAPVISRQASAKITPPIARSSPRVRRMSGPWATTTASSCIYLVATLRWAFRPAQAPRSGRRTRPFRTMASI